MTQKSRKNGQQNSGASEERKRHCGLYGRVSTDLQAAQKEGGLDTQFALMKRHVEYENDRGDGGSWEIFDCYREEARSGKNLDRPELRRLQADIAAGRIDTVIVSRLDRFTRSVRDFHVLWEFFEEHGVQFHSLNERFDTTTPMGRSFMQVILVFAQLEREQTGERTSATMVHRASQGLWNGGHLMGYDLDPDEKGVLKVNPEQARVVREEIFEAYVDLKSTPKLVKRLAERGITTPEYESRRGARRGGGHFTKQRLINLLRNPRYLGKIVWKGETHEGRHKAIISNELFEEVQAILGRNSRARGKYKNQQTHEFLLQGLVRCGGCGSAMTPKWSTGQAGKRYFYYQCTRDARSAGVDCKSRYLPAPAAEEYVLTQLRNWSMSEDEIARVVKEANENRDDQLDRLSRETKSTRDRLNVVKAKITPLVNALEDGAELASVQERLENLEQVRGNLEEELRRLAEDKRRAEERLVSTTTLMEGYRTFPEMLDRLIEAGEWKSIKDMLACFVDVIHWVEDPEDPSIGVVKIMLFEQPEPLPISDGEGGLDGALKSVNWRPREDSNSRPVV